MELREVAERVETIRNSMDEAINLCGGNRELWCRLDRIDRDLRQLKRDMWHPDAGLRSVMAGEARCDGRTAVHGRCCLSVGHEGPHINALAESFGGQRLERVK